MVKMLNVTAFLAVLAMQATAGAQGDAAAELAAIRAEMAALAARLERLERAAAAGEDQTPQAAAAASSETESPSATADARSSVQFAGDVRYRHESINDELEGERHRQRLRARFGVTADITERVEVGLTLATGGDDPVSANQTLGGGFDRKAIGVDRAFFRWAATDELTFMGGKIANPFVRAGDHHLIYDNDLNPEGLALQYRRGDWFANYAGLWVEERGGGDDSLMLGGQLGYRRELRGDMRITVGASYYDYLETQGRAPFWDGDAAGNRVDAAGNYLRDFNLAEAFAELRFRVAERPLTLFADYVVNTEADDFDKGYALGARFGEVTGPRTWRVGYAYQDLEADAVVGTFTDSDWAGGGTDGTGHVFQLDYGFRKRLSFGVRYFLNQRGANAGDERDYNRLQADVQFEY